MPELFMVELVVADLRASSKWYRQLLKIPPSFTDDEGGFQIFQLDCTRLSLRKGEPKPGETRLVFQVENLELEINRLREFGINSEGESKNSPEGYRRVFFRDPDGHRIGLFSWLRDDTSRVE